MNLEEKFALVLRNNRVIRGISQEELAYTCDLDRTYISLLERGKRKPTLHVVFKLCEALDIKTSEFILQIESLELK